MKKIMQNALMLLLNLTLLLGVIYPFFIWGAGKLFFREQADGSLIVKDGKITGSRLIGQAFSGEEYFHPRPSAVSYNAAGSGGTNLGPSNPALMDAAEAMIEKLKKENTAAVPLDMVTQSASGLDPHISPESAIWQAKRVAGARQVDEKAVIDIINSMTEKPFIGLFGGYRVNVLALNLELDRIQNGSKK